MGGNGWTGFHHENTAIDAAYDAVFSEFDPEARVPLLQEVCRQDNANPTYISLWATTRYWFVNTRVANFVNTPGPGMGNYYKAAEMWFIR